MDQRSKEKEVQFSEDNAERELQIEKYLTESVSAEEAAALCSLLEDKSNNIRNLLTKVLSESEERAIPFLLVPYVSSTDISVRNLAGEILLRRGNDSIEALIDYLDKGDDNDKKFVIDILGLIGDSSASDSILRILNTNQNENVILACLEALGNIKDADSVALLTDYYNKNELYKPTVIDALGKIASLEVLDFLLERYEKEDELTKLAMLETFGEIGNERTFFFLLGELKKMDEIFVWTIVDSLNKLRNQLGMEMPFDEITKRAVIEALKLGTVQQQKSASELICQFVDAETTDAAIICYGTDFEIDQNLKQIFFSNPSLFFTRLSKMIGNNSTNLKSVLEAVREIYDSFGPESFSGMERIEIHNFLSKLGDYITHSDEEIRRNCIELIFQIDPETALLYLDNMLLDTNIWNKMLLIDKLETQINEKTIAALTQLSSDTEEMVKERAQAVIVQIKNVS